MPGFSHTFGGLGVQEVGSLGIRAVPRDPEYDVLCAVAEWAENGNAPERLLGTHLSTDPQGMNASLPGYDRSPGGGFIQLCSGEADGVAEKFFELGYNAFVPLCTNNVTLREEYSRFSNRLNTVAVGYPITETKLIAGIESILFPADKQDPMRLGLCVNDNSVPMFSSMEHRIPWPPQRNTRLPLAAACAKHGIAYELHLILGRDHGFVVWELDSRCVERPRYLFEQLYLTIEAMTEEKFATYAGAYGNLKKRMEFDAFSEIAQQESITYYAAERTSNRSASSR